jgi:protein-S-isoprenylcysteine O-methyltransferase Ste14
LPIGLAVLLTVANFETPSPTGQLVQSAWAMVTGFGYAFLAATLLTGIGIIFMALLIKERHRQAGVVSQLPFIRVRAPSC